VYTDAKTNASQQAFEELVRHSLSGLAEKALWEEPFGSCRNLVSALAVIKEHCGLQRLHTALRQHSRPL